MSAQPEVIRLVPGDSNAQASSTLSADGGTSGGGQLSAPNEHEQVGRTPSTSSCTKSLRTAKGCSVHIKEPPVTDTEAALSSRPPTAADGDNHGPLHHAIPVMPLPLAVTCCVMNILLPGVGLYVY